MSAIDRVLARLKGVKRVRNGWMALCPNHNDRENSLSVGVGDEDRVLVKCFAGCPRESVVKAMGLEMKDLFRNPGQRRKGARAEGIPIPRGADTTVQPPVGLTLARYAEAKRLPVDFLRGLGLSDMSYLGQPVVRTPHLDEVGAEVAVQFRLALEGENRFRWKRGAKPCPYGLWRLDRARAGGYVVLVEGASDAQTLWLHDIPGLGLPGADSWQEAWAEYLNGITLIYVVVEPDAGGQALTKWLAASRIRDRVRLVALEGAKDPSALYLQDRERFPERWRATLEVASRWSEKAEAATDAERRAAWARCADLAQNPNILNKFQEDLRRRGVVGEARPAKLLYLVVVSRLLDHPASAAVKGPSSAGKSFLVENVLGFFPPSTYYALSAMSERALAYSEEPLAHRVLVIYEAVGLRSELASYLVRSLLSEGRVRYETVEKTKTGLRPRLIEREGPTALIVTTTAVRLHEENETRLLTIPVTDTPDQTRAVLRETARRRRHSQCVPIDVQAWHALQEWLTRAECRVVIPYAEILAELMPPVAVRLRRDFGVMLTLIEAHAILHQTSRQRGADGAIIAEPNDYAVVRDLVAEILSEGIEMTVPQTVKETVAAVEKLTPGSSGGATVVAVARELKLDKSTASRRVRTALERGYLRNLETKEGRPACLVLGEPLPNDQPVLPAPDDPRLERCMVASVERRINRPPSPQLVEVEL